MLVLVVLYALIAKGEIDGMTPNAGTVDTNPSGDDDYPIGPGDGAGGDSGA